MGRDMSRTPAAASERPIGRYQASSIQRRLLTSIATLVVAAIGMTVVSQVVLAQTVSRVNAEIAQANEVADETQQLQLALIRERAIAFGFASGEGDAATEQFELASELEIDAYIALTRAAANDELILGAMSEVREQATEWRENWAEPFLRSDSIPTASTIAEGDRLYEPVESALTALATVTDAYRQTAARDLAAVVDNMNAVMVPVVIGASFAIAVGGFFVTRSISGPLQRLHSTAQSLLAGEAVRFVPEGRDEIGGLAVILEQMRVEAADRYELTRVQAETAATFNQLGELTTFAQDEETLVDAAIRVLARIAPSHRGTVMLVNNSTNRLVVAGAWGEDTPAVATIADLKSIDQCPGIRRATAYVAADLSDPLVVRCPAHRADVGTVACLPMPALGSTVGVIHLERAVPNSFDSRDVSSASRTAEQVALAIANARLMKTMEGLANTDPLTGLRNPRFFDAHLERELAVAVAERRSVAVILLDVDYFKRFNDTHGHPAGDEALRALGRTLRAIMREGDVVARYGGEEFVVALRDTTLERAMAAAEKMRLAVEQAAFEIGPGRYGRITISLGVVATDQQPVDRKGLIALADAALYRAKEAGRNRVEAAPTSPEALNAAASRRRGDRNGHAAHDDDVVARGTPRRAKTHTPEEARAIERRAKAQPAASGGEPPRR